MTENENLNPKADGHNPIEAIRSIIFGDQEKTLNQKLEEIDNKFKELSVELAEKFKELHTQQNADRKQFSQKLAKMQAIIEGNDKNTEEKLIQINNTIRQTQVDLDSSKLNRTTLADQLESLVNHLRNNK